MENRTTIQITEDLRKELRVLSAARDISYQELLKDMIEVFKELDREKTIISIPTKLAQKTNKKIQDTDFQSISEFISFLIRMYLVEKTEKQKQGHTEKKVKEKLKRLGYM